MEIDSSFLEKFSTILQQQNSMLLKQICLDYNWNYDEMHKLFLEDNEDNNFEFTTTNTILIRNEWSHNGNSYYVEEGTNNVYLDGIFKGKKYEDELFSDCEET